MLQAAQLLDLMPRQLSFKHCVQVWVAWDCYRRARDSDEDLRALFVLIAEQRVGDRPGRVEPRAVKRRPKPYPLLMKTRDSARAYIRKHGHPKKQK